MKKESTDSGLPKCAAEYIDLVAKKVRYHRRVRAEVREELAGHFADALRKCASDTERQEAARKLIAEFGEPKVLAKLIRRGKKRCRPIWVKALIHTCQVFGILILLIVIRGASLSIGTPCNAIDHYAKLTEFGRGVLDEKQNAAPVLEKAASVMVETPKWLLDKSSHLPLEMNDVELGELKGWLASNAEALNLVRAASMMPGRWVDYSAIPEPNASTWASKGLSGVLFSAAVMQQSLPDLTSAKGLIYMLRWHSLYEAQEGHTASAIDDAIAAVRLGTLYEDKGLLVDDLVGIAAEVMGETLLCEIAATGKCDKMLLADSQERLHRLYLERPTTVGLSGERVLWDEMIQSSYTENGRMLGQGILVLCRDWTSLLGGLVFGFPSKAEAQKVVDDYFGIVEESIVKTPWQRRTEAATYEKRLTESGMLLQILGPGLVKGAETGWQARARRGATLAILAIERYRLEKGRLPESLDELVKDGYLAELPMDPWSNGPLVYRKTDESYTLYSVGEDFRDDGGKARPSDLKERSKGGWDEMFWPVK